MAKMSPLRYINKTIKGFKKDIKTTHKSVEGVKKSKNLIRLEKHFNKAIKGLHSFSQTTTGRTHKKGKKYKKTSLKISSQVEDNPWFPSSSQSAMGYMPPMRGKDFLPLYKMSEKVSSPGDSSLRVNGDGRRLCNFGIVPTKRRSGLPPSDIPDIPIEKIQRAYGVTCRLPKGFAMRIKQAVLIRKGFGWNKNDPDFTKKELISLENGIHRSACFYTAAKILPPEWKYDPTIAGAL